MSVGKYGLILGFILLSVFIQAENINLLSESLPGLGAATTFCDYGDYGLFVGGYHHLAIIDYNDPSGMPVAVFDIPNNYYKSYDVLRYANHAYLFIQESMFILSLEDLLHPRLVAEIDLHARRRACLIQDNVLYIASFSGSLTSYSLNNPEYLINLDTLSIPDFNYESMFAGDGFIACQGDSLYIVDSSNPSDLRLAGSIAYTDSFPDNPNSQAAALGQYLVINSLNQLYVFDLADPYNPNQISSFVLPCDDLIYKTHVHDNVLWSIYLDGNFETNQIGLISIDLGNPSSPVVCQKQQLGEDWVVINASQLLRASGNRVALFYPTYLPQGIRTGLLNGSSCELSYIQIRYGSMNKMVATDDWIVGLNPLINILDYKPDNTLFSKRQIIPESYFCDVLQIKGDLLFYAYTYLYNEDQYSYAPTLDIYDLQSGTRLSSFPLPVEQGGEFPPTPKRIEFYNNYALLCNGLGGLICFDISNPANPVQVFRIWDPFYAAQDVAVRGTELWLGTYMNMYGGWLRHYDISNFASPVHDFDVFLDGRYPSELLLSGDYLYLKSSGLISCFHLGESEIISQQDFGLSGTDMENLLPFGKGLLVGGDIRMWVLSLESPISLMGVGTQQLQMVYPDYPEDPNYYPNAFYAVQGDRILVANGHYVKCFDASLAATMCYAELDLETPALQIFPNPSREKVYIGFNAEDYGEGKIELYNLRGQKVISRSLSSVKQGFNLQNLALTDDKGRRLGAGVYIVQIHTPGKKQVARLVVTN